MGFPRRMNFCTGRRQVDRQVVLPASGAVGSALGVDGTCLGADSTCSIDHGFAMPQTRGASPGVAKAPICSLYPRLSSFSVWSQSLRNVMRIYGSTVKKHSLSLGILVS